MPPTPTSAPSLDALKSEFYECIPVSQRYINYTLFVNGSSRVVVKNNDYSDSTTFSNSLDGVYLCYELATPTVIQLTPRQISLLKGINNISVSDDYSEIILTYRSGEVATLGDLKETENKMLAKQHNYSTDEQVVGTWLNGETLYEKTFVYDPPLSLPYNTWVESDSVLGNGWKIIQQSCIDIYNANMGGVNITPYSTNGKVAYMNLRDNTSLLFYAILQYTKST
ncbi:MAG: hypothetical protein IKP88_14855 [Lachnospiraceae bacterium]|nr:hypothetical protein [Lachnospiraceae bacterium]